MQKIAPRISDDALQLAQICDHHALAVETVSRVLAECPDLAASDYIRRLSKESERLDLCDASFELSYRLLPEELQRRWRMLSALRVHFDCGTASCVWRINTDEAQKCLSTLLRYNLLQWDSKSQKYRFHDLTYLSAKARISPTEQAIVWARRAALLSRRRSPSKKLYIGNLPWKMDSDALLSVFASFGHVDHAIVFTDRLTGRSRGFGFVTLTKLSSAILALGALDGTITDGRPLKVNFARPNEPRSSWIPGES